MRALAWIACGVLAGFLLGGVGPRRELASTRTQMAALERQLENSGGGGRTLLETLLGGMAPEPEPISTPATAAPVAAPTPRPGTPMQPDEGERAEDTGDDNPSEAPTEAEEGYEDNPDGTSRATPSWWRRADQDRSAATEEDDSDEVESDREPGERRSMRGPGGRRLTVERFREMVSTQKVRAASSRAALIEKADLDEDQVAAVDEVVTDMNSRLSGYGEELLSVGAQEEGPENANPGDMLEAAEDVFGIMGQAQRKVESIVQENVPPEEAAGMDEEEAPEPRVWDMIDLESLQEWAEQQLPSSAQGGDSGGEGAAEGPRDEDQASAEEEAPSQAPTGEDSTGEGSP